MEANEYDLVVIGSGPAGQKGAICAAKLGKKVAIIDRKRTIGGGVRAYWNHSQQNPTRGRPLPQWLSAAFVLRPRLRAERSHCDVGPDLPRASRDEPRDRGHQGAIAAQLRDDTRGRSPLHRIHTSLKSEVRMDRSWFVGTMSYLPAEPGPRTAMTFPSTENGSSIPIRCMIWRKCRGTTSLWGQETRIRVYVCHARSEGHVARTSAPCCWILWTMKLSRASASSYANSEPCSAGREGSLGGIRWATRSRICQARERKECARARAAFHHRRAGK